jgi:hypothetical protein
MPPFFMRGGAHGLRLACFPFPFLPSVIPHPSFFPPCGLWSFSFPPSPHYKSFLKKVVARLSEVVVKNFFDPVSLVNKGYFKNFS